MAAGSGLHVHFQSCLPIAFWKLCVSWECGSAGEHVPSVHKTLCSMPSTKNKAPRAVRLHQPALLLDINGWPLRYKWVAPYPGACNLERSDSFITECVGHLCHSALAQHDYPWPLPLSLTLCSLKEGKAFLPVMLPPPGSKGFLSPKSGLCQCWDQKWRLLGSLGRYKQQDSSGKLPTKWRVWYLPRSMFPHSGNSPLLCRHALQCKLLKVLVN